jgi:hypothetical protein
VELRVAAGLDFSKLQRALSVRELMLANPGKFFISNADCFRVESENVDGHQIPETNDAVGPESRLFRQIALNLMTVP